MLNKIINFDLHIHSIYSEYKEEKNYVSNSNEDNIDILLKKLNEKNINLFSITDHNRFSYNLYTKLKNKINSPDYPNVQSILPGIEFDVQLEDNKESCHIIAIFDDSNLEKISKIEQVLNDNRILTKKDDFYNKNEFEKILKEIKCSVILIAHQHKALDNPEGGKRSLSNSVEDVYEYISTGYINALEYQKPSVQGMIINSLKKAEKNIATVIGSDCHKWECYPCKDEDSGNKNYVSKIKALPTFDGLVFSFTSFKTRFNRVENKNMNYIKSIKCNDKEYQLCNGINAIIGDNGSGKTLLLEMISSSNVKSYYNRIIKSNSMEIEKKGAPSVEYIKQNEIIDNVKKGELFKKENNNYFDNILNKDIFKKNIKDYSIKLINYIQGTITIKNKIDSLEQLNFSPVIISEKNYIPSINKEIDDVIDVYKERYNELNRIYIELEKEYNDNLSFYNENYKELESIIKSMNIIQKDLENKHKKIAKCNDIINLIKSSLDTFDSNVETKRTDKEKENNDYINNLNDFCNEIVSTLKQQICERKIPNFPKPLPGKTEKTNEGFYFVKKTKYDNVDLSNEFFEELFNNGYNKTNIFNIDNEDDLVQSLTGIKSIEQLSTWYNSVDKFTEKYSSEETTIEKKLDKKIIGKTPGEISIVYYDFKFGNFDKTKNVLLIDQPEDDISNNKISKELISYIEKVRDKKQVIIVTHNPLLVVNLDVDNVICLNKNNMDMITIKSGCLEYREKEYSVIENIANLMDGGKEAIERRFALYENSKSASVL